MNEIADRIYLGTILLEKNRWARPKTPSYRVSDWLGRFAEAGFDGIELWEYHATLAAPGELEALAAAPLPVAVFNTYCGFEDVAEPQRRTAVEIATAVGAGGVKFNVGREPARREEYLRNLRAWAEAFDPGVRLLCECHGGTILETPAAAAEFFDEAGAGRFEAIVHCFAQEPDRLAGWFDQLGPAVTHAHVALRGEQGAIRLSGAPERVRRAVALMRRRGYAGSFTLEFTEGTAAPDEDIDALWQAALDDLRFLREALRS